MASAPVETATTASDTNRGVKRTRTTEDGEIKADNDTNDSNDGTMARMIAISQREISRCKNNVLRNDNDKAKPLARVANKLLEKPGVNIWPSKMSWMQLEARSIPELSSLYHHYHHDWNAANATDITHAQLVALIHQEISVDLTD